MGYDCPTSAHSDVVLGRTVWIGCGGLLGFVLVLIIFFPVQSDALLDEGGKRFGALAADEFLSPPSGRRFSVHDDLGNGAALGELAPQFLLAVDVDQCEGDAAKQTAAFNLGDDGVFHFDARGAPFGSDQDDHWPAGCVAVFASSSVGIGVGGGCHQDRCVQHNGKRESEHRESPFCGEQIRGRMWGELEKTQHPGGQFQRLWSCARKLELANLSDQYTGEDRLGKGLGNRFFRFWNLHCGGKALGLRAGYLGKMGASSRVR